MTARMIMLGVVGVGVLVVASACGGNDGAVSPPDAPIGADAMPDGKRLFVTAADFTGGFGAADFTADGAVFADQQCQTAAQGAGLSGTWHAWLSRYGDGTLPSRTATERVTGEGPWYLTGTNELVFLNRSALANTPRVAINHNEFGVLVAAGPVWTATGVGGMWSGSDCEFWRSSNSGARGTVGLLQSTGSEWTYTATTISCGARARLYCFQM